MARPRTEHGFLALRGAAPGGSCGLLEWPLLGAHNVDNALAALAAAYHVGVEVERGIEALREFRGVARRMQLDGEARGVRIYDDFAHHPTAIATTLDGLRRRVGAARIVAVLEPRSAHHASRACISISSRARYERRTKVWLYAPPGLGWDVQAAVAPLGAACARGRGPGCTGRALAATLRSGDHLLIMSNGGFGGLHGRVLAALERGIGAPRG